MTKGAKFQYEVMPPIDPAVQSIRPIRVDANADVVKLQKLGQRRQIRDAQIREMRWLYISRHSPAGTAAEELTS